MVCCRFWKTFLQDLHKYNFINWFCTWLRPMKYVREKIEVENKNISFYTGLLKLSYVQFSLNLRNTNQTYYNKYFHYNFWLQQIFSKSLLDMTTTNLPLRLKKIQVFFNTKSLLTFTNSKYQKDYNCNSVFHNAWLNGSN